MCQLEMTCQLKVLYSFHLVRDSLSEFAASHVEMTSNIDRRYEQEIIASLREMFTQTFSHRFSFLSPSPPGF